MQPGLPPHMAEQFQDKLRFIKGLVSQPKQVGAIVPTSVHMAKRMAGIADPASDLPVLELGPYHVKRYGWELRNLPPAQMWMYHRHG